MTGLAEPHPGPASVLIDELDAGQLEGLPDHRNCGSARPSYPGFKLLNGQDR